MLRAGHLSEIKWSSGDWVFLDIGFSEKQPSCGLLIGDGKPVNVRFGEAVKQIVASINKSVKPVNLVIEAPLSIAFNKDGNPTGRSIEKQSTKTRYWYLQGGCSVMVASLYLVRKIHENCHGADIRLFEGFVSFKKGKTSHSEDVMRLREVTKQPKSFPRSVVSPMDLKKCPSDICRSAFDILGLDVGIPPVIKR